MFVGKSIAIEKINQDSGLAMQFVRSGTSGSGY